MQKLLLIITSLLVMCVTKSYANSDFWYNKEQLDLEFRELDNNEITELSKVNLQSIDSAEFTLYDLELEPFCTGFCCGPVGLITYYKGKNSETNKKSYWLGCASLTVSLAAAFVGLVIYDGGFFFF